MTQTRKSDSKRVGLTLMEILLVLAIVILVAAMAVPMLQRSLESQKIGSAADRVRAECGKARVSSIRTGEVYAFFYAENGNFFAVAPFREAENFIGRTNSTAEEDRFSDFDFSKNLLPRGVRFIGAKVVNDTRSQMEQAEAGQVSGMTPILFYPDGKSQSAEIFLMAEQTGETWKVKVRGLTGTTSSIEVEE